MNTVNNTQNCTENGVVVEQFAANQREGERRRWSQNCVTEQASEREREYHTKLHRERGGGGTVCIKQKSGKELGMGSQNCITVRASERVSERERERGEEGGRDREGGGERDTERGGEAKERGRESGEGTERGKEGGRERGGGGKRHTERGRQRKEREVEGGGGEEEPTKWATERRALIACTVPFVKMKKG